MSYNPAVPLSSDSPSIFPAQSQANFTRLQTIVGADHVFNLSAASNDGYHNIVHLTQQAPTGALTGFGRFYGKLSGANVQAFYMDDAGRDYQMSPTMPIRASVSFQGTGAVGVQVIRSQYNVTSVTKTATGAYTVVFTNAMPDVNYIAHITGMRSSSGTSIYGSIKANAVITDSIKTTELLIVFMRDGGTLTDTIVGNLTILSVA